MCGTLFKLVFVVSISVPCPFTTHTKQHNKYQCQVNRNWENAIVGGLSLNEYFRNMGEPSLTLKPAKGSFYLTICFDLFVCPTALFISVATNVILEQWRIPFFVFMQHVFLQIPTLCTWSTRGRSTATCGGSHLGATCGGSHLPRVAGRLPRVAGPICHAWQVDLPRVAGPICHSTCHVQRVSPATRGGYKSRNFFVVKLFLFFGGALIIMCSFDLITPFCLFRAAIYVS